MVLLRAQELLNRANNGELLTQKERRHCIDYILSNSSSPLQEDDENKKLLPITNQEMADLFQVSVRQITKDKAFVRKKRASELSNEDVTLVLADLSYTFDEQLAKAKRALSMTKPGTELYLKYVKTITDIAVQRVKILQDLGYYPKSLGNLTVDSFDFTANIDPMTGKGQIIKTKDAKTIIDVKAELIEDSVMTTSDEE